MLCLQRATTVCAGDFSRRLALTRVALLGNHFSATGDEAGNISGWNAAADMDVYLQETMGCGNALTCVSDTLPSELRRSQKTNVVPTREPIRSLIVCLLRSNNRDLVPYCRS